MLLSSSSSRPLARTAASTLARGLHPSGPSSASSSSTSSSPSSSRPSFSSASYSAARPSLSSPRLYTRTSSKPARKPWSIIASSPSITTSAASPRLSSDSHPPPPSLSSCSPPLRPPPLRPAKTAFKADVIIPSSSQDVEWSHVHGSEEEGGAKAPIKVVFLPGTILEALKGQLRIVGVVLDTVILEERLRLRLLTPSGAIVYPYAESVLFAFSSNSVPLSLVDATGTSDVDLDAAQTAARSKIVGILRRILTESTKLRNEVEPAMDDAWERFRFKAFEGDEDGKRKRVLVTTAQVANWVKEETASRKEGVQIAEGGKTKKGKEVEETEEFRELRLHRVYCSMMGRPEAFIVQETAQWQTEIWRVRSEEDVREMELVDGWMKSRHPNIDSFITKCQTIIDHTRPLLSAHLASSPETPPPSLLPLDSEASVPSFTNSDRVILSHIQSSVLNSRSQRSHFASTVPTLLKKIDRFGGIVDAKATTQFLVEVGVRTPWDDVGTMFGLMELNERAKEDEGVTELFEELAKREKEGTRNVSSEPSLSTYNSLGPDEFYPSDPLATIRHDFGDLPVYVIDDIEASELDDGVSVERSSREGHVWIHAHIADPTTLLHPKHRLSRLAAQRASTSYLPQGNFALLPEEISIERFSLGKNGKLVEGEGQECMTFSAEVNETTGEVVDYKIRAGIIRKINVTTYATVCQVLGGRRRPTSFPLGPPSVRAPFKTLLEPQPSWTPDLKLLLRTSRAIAFRRLRKGGLNWSLPSYSIKVSPRPLPSLPLYPSSIVPILSQGSPVVDYEVQSPTIDEATEIVSICMTLAGNVAGRFLADRSIPGPYRTYPSPVGTTADSMAQLLETRDPRTGDVSPFDIARFGVVFLPGAMQPRPGGHWMMGLEEKEGGYVRVTSPLRRYADLIAHWQIKHALLAEHILGTSAGAGGKALMNDDEMYRAITASDSISHLVHQTQKRSLAFWGAYALARHARTIDPNLASLPSPTSSTLPPVFRGIFDPLPTPIAGRLGPYRSVVLGTSFVTPQDQTKSSVMVLIPELGLQFAASHPTGDGPYGPGDEVNALLDRMEFGPRPAVGGVVFS